MWIMYISIDWVVIITVRLVSKQQTCLCTLCTMCTRKKYVYTIQKDMITVQQCIDRDSSKYEYWKKYIKLDFLRENCRFIN